VAITHAVTSVLRERFVQVEVDYEMGQNGDNPDRIETLMTTPDLADALDSQQFRRFLDQVPIALIVSEIREGEHIVYANPEFEHLSGQPAAELVGSDWEILRGQLEGPDPQRTLGHAITGSSDFLGTFLIERSNRTPAIVDAYSNLIENDDGTPCYRLAALVDVGEHEQVQRDQLAEKIREKDTLLQEIQHRVKNNLQLITALIRIDARNVRGRLATAAFDRLAGRIEAIQLIYQLLSEHGGVNEVDLGIYLSEVASSVMRAHAVEGIRLDLKVDAYPVSVNVALPTGLVVNELLTNALKHAFVGRDGGTITLHSLSDGNGCRITIADNGVGLPPGVAWPKQGKLGALIVQSLRENARAQLEVQSTPGEGLRVIIVFTRSAAAAAAA
jgi:PAS domain S-box-containing protein